jgi:hypothetical protein
MSAAQRTLAERIARGRAAVNEARARGQDATRWEHHLAQLEAQHTAHLYGDLEVLLGVIADGCRLGLHGQLDAVPAEAITSVLDAHDGPEGEYLAACHRAGETAMLAVAVEQYRLKMHRLAALREDVDDYAGALDICLSQPTNRPQRQEEGAPVGLARPPPSMHHRTCAHLRVDEALSRSAITYLAAFLATLTTFSNRKVT